MLEDFKCLFFSNKAVYNIPNNFNCISIKSLLSKCCKDKFVKGARGPEGRSRQNTRGSFSKRTQCHLAAGVRESRTRVHSNRRIGLFLHGVTWILGFSVFIDQETQIRVWFYFFFGSNTKPNSVLNVIFILDSLSSSDILGDVCTLTAADKSGRGAGRTQRARVEFWRCGGAMAAARRTRVTMDGG